jgi:hypothetical protein
MTNPKVHGSERTHAIVTLRSGKGVDNQQAKQEVDHAEPEVDLPGKVAQESERVTTRKKEMLSHL